MKIVSCAAGSNCQTTLGNWDIRGIWKMNCSRLLSISGFLTFGYIYVFLLGPGFKWKVMLFWFLPARNRLIFLFSKFWYNMCDHPLPTFPIPLLCRQQGLCDKILMTLDLNNNVSHQHIFNRAMHLWRLASEGISPNGSRGGLRGRHSGIGAAPEKARLSCSSCRMKWGFMNHCQGNYITGCKLNLGFNIYRTQGWRI